MICTKCGETLPDESELCPKCGANLKETEPAETAAAGAETAAKPAAATEAETPVLATAPAEPEVRSCVKCGKPLTEGQAFCPNCGTAASVKRNCVRCGAELAEGQTFCAACGQAAIPAAMGGAAAQKSKKKLFIILGSAAAALIIIVAILLAVVLGSGPNFKKIYQEYCSPTWASVGADGSYLSIDTNPRNKDNTGIAYQAAANAVKKVNEVLGLPDSLYEEMGSTRALDGRQSQTFGNITVSWSYHPDKGLEVTYRKAK